MVSVSASSTEEPRRPGRPADADAAATRERILAAARRAFATDGYDATTNKTVAMAAGITPAALYHYFHSKGDLYRAVCESMYESLDRALQPGRFAGGTLHERLAAIIEVIARGSSHDPSLTAFIVGLNDEARRHPETREMLLASHRLLRDRMKQIVEEATDAEQILGSGRTAPFAELFLASLGGVARLAVRRGDPASMRAPLEALLALVRTRD